MKKIAIITAILLCAGFSYGTIIASYNFDSEPLGVRYTGDGTHYDYDYTRNAYFDVSSKVSSNTLAFLVGKYTNYEIADRGAGHGKCLYLTGSGTPDGKNVGFVLLDMDFTGDGLNSTEAVRVSWSFDILGTSGDADFNPTGWKLALKPNSDWAGYSTTSDFSSDVVQTFDVPNAGFAASTGWITITGYVDVPAGEAGSYAGLKIIPPASGSISAGYGFVCLDNLAVDVSPLPSSASWPATVASWDFDSDPLGVRYTGDGVHYPYDYTRNTYFEATSKLATATLASLMGKYTNYEISDRGTGHEKCLYLTGNGTPSGGIVGIYLFNLDLTGGALNWSEPVQINWSFDILGTSADTDFNPNDWTVVINSANIDPDLDMTTDDFTNTVQTFSFTNEGLNATSGWATVTGSIEIPAGEAGNLGAIEIRPSASGSIGTGYGFVCLDNILVQIAPVTPPVPQYSDWLNNYPSLGSSTNQTDDPDGDGLNNLYEFAFGGNPTNSSDTGLQSTWQNLGGTIEYVYYRFSDASERGLTYEVQVDDDLVAAPGWTNLGVTVTGTNVGAVVNDAGTFDVISNQVPMDVDAKFIRLKVDLQQ